MTIDADTDPTAGYHGGNPESTAAHASVKPSKRTLRLQVYSLLRTFTNGLTCDQIEATTGWSHQTTSARVTELKRAGWIKDSGRRRPTRSGRSAAVLVAVRTDR